MQFVGVDPVDDAAKMLAFAAARGVDYPLLLDSDGKLITGAEVASFPTTLFVSADGRIVHQTSAIEADDLRVDDRRRVLKSVSQRSVPARVPAPLP